MRSFLASIPVFFSIAAGLVMANRGGEPSDSNPFSTVETVERAGEPVVIEKPVLDEARLAAWQEKAIDAMKGVAESQSSESLSRFTTLARRVDEIAKKQESLGGAGFQPFVPESSGQCDCNCDGKCLSEEDVRRIVSDEFNKQKLAEVVAPSGYGLGVSVASGQVVRYSAPVYSTPVYSSPTVTYQSSVPTAQPTSVVRQRTGLFGRRTVLRQSAGSTCRVVNGQVICN